MMTRFKNKLRMSGFEDRLQQELGLSASASSWLSRLARDCARARGIDLLSVRGDVLADTLFWHLECAGYDGLLDKLAADSDVLAGRLERYRTLKTANAA